MNSDQISKWGHPFTDQGGHIDELLLAGLSNNQIVSAFLAKYPTHKNPRRRVVGHLNHLRDTHNVDIKAYFDKAQGIYVNHQHSNIRENYSYLPTEGDFKTAYQQIAKPGQEISVDAVLDQIEIDAKKAGRNLKEDWRIITERNIEIWSNTLKSKR